MFPSLITPDFGLFHFISLFVFCFLFFFLLARPFLAGLRDSQVISLSRSNPKRLSSFKLMKAEFWVLSSPFVCVCFFKNISRLQPNFGFFHFISLLCVFFSILFYLTIRNIRINLRVFRLFSHLVLPKTVPFTMGLRDSQVISLSRPDPGRLSNFELTNI